MEEVYVPPDLSGKDQVEALDDSEKLVEKFMLYASNQSKVHRRGYASPGPVYGLKASRQTG